MIKKFSENMSNSSITIDIPVIDRYAIPMNIHLLIRDKIFGDDAKNAFQLLYLCDNDYGSSLEIVTKYFRENGITSDKVLIDNTW